MKSRVILLAAVLLAAFSTAEAQKTTTTKKIKLQGVEQVETLSDDGTSIKKRPYRWFADIAEADNEATAIEMAQLEAYANISRVIENIVTSQAERGTIVVNGCRHSAFPYRNCFLHKLTTLVDSNHRILKPHNAGCYQRGIFTQTVAAGRLALQPVFAHHSQRCHAAGQNGRLGILCQAQFLFRPIKAHFSNGKSQCVIRFRKHLFCAGVVVVKILAHTNFLGTLSGEYKCCF